MCCAMTLTTVGKLLQHRLDVGLRVAGRACRCELVPVLVAKNTGQIVMLGCALGQLVIGLTMTGPAPPVGRLWTVRDHQGHVRRVA